MVAVHGHLLIGPPGSGKSTLARQIQASLPQSCVVSTDQIRQTLYGNAAEQGAWPDIEAEVVRQIIQALGRGDAVIYDATNARRSWRVAFLQRLHPLGIPWVGWYLKTPLALCQQRNLQRDRQVPAAVIETSYEALQRCPPSIAEGFVAIYALEGEAPYPQVDHYLRQIQKP
ncbi:MAG: AAA family ATPase [Spirulina sp.]